MLDHAQVFFSNFKLLQFSFDVYESLLDVFNGCRCVHNFSVCVEAQKRFVYVSYQLR